MLRKLVVMQSGNKPKLIQNEQYMKSKLIWLHIASIRTTGLLNMDRFTLGRQTERAN